MQLKYSHTFFKYSTTVLVFAIQVYSHSWLACTDYAEKNADTWNANKCRGFPRNAEVMANKDGIFGNDRGYDHQPNENNACGQPRNDAAYSTSHPMAVYYPGQQVILVHPMKNHGADAACSSIWIPDSGSWLYGVRSRPEDPTLSQLRSNLIAELGRSPKGKDFGGDSSRSSVYPKPGFGNAPRFCEGTDKALATYSFNVPKNLRPGLYTFMWGWSFNDLGNLYTTCYEVNVVANKRARDSRLRAAGFNDLYEPCGGLTSEPTVRGNTNPGCTTPPGGNQRAYAATAGGLPPTTRPNIPITAFFDTTTARPRTTTTRYYATTPYSNPWIDYTTRRTTTRRTTTRRPTTEKPYETTTEYEVKPEYEVKSPYARPPLPSSIRLSVRVHMKSTQFSGEMWLPFSLDNTIRRYINVDFTCEIDTASFWNCMTISDMDESNKSGHFELLQQGYEEVHNNRIYYHVSYKQPCDLSLHPPIVRLVQEDLQQFG